MHFSKLRLSGFKSFVDPTELTIESGLTGVVGPNGCGKSNLVEALRWAMGETSAKRMRGGEMDDVIFAGTSKRPARNIAEVTLLMDNTQRNAPGTYDDTDEIEVTRRIERGSGSSYRVNGREVRARDVQLLFADAASGAHSTALVSQGRIGAIINAKPVERRALLEEAAGIAGLHARRHEAELRLKAAEANLARLDDVLVTLAAQLEALRKQAKQAQRYRRVSEQLRRIEAIALHLRWQAASSELAAATARLHAAERDVAARTQTALEADRVREAVASELPALRQAEVAAAAELQRLNHARQALDEEERRVAQARDAAGERLTQLAADQTREDDLAADARAAIERLEAERLTLVAAQANEAEAQQKAAEALAAATAAVNAAEAELGRRTQEIAAEEARRAALERQIKDAQGRRARLVERQNELARQHQALDTELAAAPPVAEAEEALAEATVKVETSRQTADTAAATLKAAETKVAVTRSPLQAAETKRAKLRAEIQALTELLSAFGDKRWTPILDALEVEPGYEAAIGAALGDDLVAPLDPESPQHWHTLPAYPYALALPGDTGSLADHVKAPPALGRRLAQIGIVADSAAAEQLQTSLVPGQRLVTLDGGLWRWDGLRRAAGIPSATGQRLRQRNRLAELTEEMRVAERELASLAESFEEAQTELRQAGEAERGARDAMRHALNELAKAQDDEAKRRRHAAALTSRLASIEESAQRLAVELNETTGQETTAQEGLSALPDPSLGREEIAGLRTQVSEHRSIEQACRGEHERLKREIAARGQRLVALFNESKSWEGRAEAAARQRTRIEERRTALNAEIALLESRPAEIAEERERLSATIAASTQKRNEASDALAIGETHLAEAEKARKAAEAALAIAREERVRAEALRDQADENQRNIVARISERMECTPDAILATANIEAGEEMPALDEAETRFERLTRERDNMGPVNLVAESEATEVEERYEGLAHEREDLTAAIARLRQGISALNREGRERMLAAFAQVNEHFTKLFETLFGGGRAYLKLDQPQPEEGEAEGSESVDPLEAGLEILASPPGKRLQTISLLSGGEQALTALALIFAVFLTNPAPVCVLDEVDAPLDDANVDRFCRLVAEIADTAETRFLIITHHRLTMARMDRLFGVTMSEQGVSQLVSVDLQQAEALRKTA